MPELDFLQDDSQQSIANVELHDSRKHVSLQLRQFLCLVTFACTVCTL